MAVVGGDDGDGGRNLPASATPAARPAVRRQRRSVIQLELSGRQEAAKRRGVTHEAGLLCLGRCTVNCGRQEVPRRPTNG